MIPSAPRRFRYASQAADRGERQQNPLVGTPRQGAGHLLRRGFDVASASMGNHDVGGRRLHRDRNNMMANGTGSKPVVVCIGGEETADLASNHFKRLGLSRIENLHLG